MQDKNNQNQDATQHCSVGKSTPTKNADLEKQEFAELRDKISDISDKMNDYLDRYSLKNSFMLAVFEYAKNATQDNDYQRNIDNLQIIFHTL